MPSIIALAFGVVAGTYVFFLGLLYFTQNPKEPPSIEDGIPFFTPLVGLWSKGVGFHRQMMDKYNIPIYTLRIPGSRMYIVNSTSLITSIQTQFRTLSFTAIQARAASSFLGANDTTINVLGKDVNVNEGYLMSFPKYTHSSLGAGVDLDAMTRRSVQVINDSLRNLAQRGNTNIKLFEWIRHELLIATTEAVYGPKNPYRDPKMERAWYKFEEGILIFIMRLMPRVFAKESFDAREYMVKVWEEYFESGSYKQASAFTNARVKIDGDFQLSLKETARLELGGSQAILTNTLPAAFWMIYQIFSDPVVLKDIRDELSKGMQKADDDTYSIDLDFVKSSCPILLSTFKEMIRFNSTTIAARIAIEDHLLNGKYLLKKDSLILMPALVQHYSPSIYGDTVNEFDHKRFVRKPGDKRLNPVAFRGFGGGTNLCPGRHYASAEILMFSALMVLHYDLYPTEGKWVKPSTPRSIMVSVLPVPSWDIDVEMRPRDDKVWNVSFTTSNTEMEIIAEDMKATDVA